MLSKLLVLLAVTITDVTTKPGLEGLPAPQSFRDQISTTIYPWWEAASAIYTASLLNPAIPISSLGEISTMLHESSTNLQEAVINKVLTILQCALQQNMIHNNILTIIDYSLPSNEKRLWVFDLREKKLLFYTYVSHGITSGTLLSKFFSNKNNSKATSIGVFKTKETYFGRDGLSLRLSGLDSGVNNNAATRYIVMHGGWYVSEDFIKRYGRPGRSWGCPAVPENVKESLIHTIQGNSLFVAYYPSDNWLTKSKFLNCQKYTMKDSPMIGTKVDTPLQDEGREEVLLVGLGKTRGEGSEAVVAMSADNYQRIFHSQPPLARMLRRQILQMEYVALSKTEFNNLVANANALPDNEHKEDLAAINLVIPVVKNVRGYWETQMQIVDTGKVITASLGSMVTEKKPLLTFRPTKQFIRWLGL